MLSPEVLILLILDGAILLFLTLSFFTAVLIVRYFDFSKDTPLQYYLERRSYLVSVILHLSFSLKIPLLFYFVYTLDKLSNVIPGAMCAAGVITSNSYGVALLAVKVLNIYLFGLWLVANREDFFTKEYRFTKFKFKFFIFIYLFVVGEFILELLFFKSLDVSKVVSCCGVLFDATKNSTLFSFFLLDSKLSAGLFYLSFFLLLFFRKKIYLFSLLTLIFLLFSLISLIQFFSPYIYQLPTHHCPFCLLQKEYFYVGYLLYTFLFLGTFLGVSVGFKKFFLTKEDKSWPSLLFDSLYLLVVTFYPVWYLFKNGVTLF
ncbi:MAG: hypothetical protein GXO61_00735 [Epsilonproteobacteria bacterium]|nr:hypothetical protein [Campylobacterota bacterium]